jgi:hypothetical protein
MAEVRKEDVIRGRPHWCRSITGVTKRIRRMEAERDGFAHVDAENNEDV